MYRYRLLIRFIGPVRGTLPLEKNLVEAHVRAIAGRMLALGRKFADAGNEDELKQIIDDWKKNTTVIFRRKQYNGTEQLALGASQIVGVLHERARALGLSKIVSLAALKQAVFVHPALIGLRRAEGPIVVPDEIEQAPVAASHGSAVRQFELVRPPAWTEVITIDVENADVARLIPQILARGRLGASRKQGYGLFTTRFIEIPSIPTIAKKSRKSQKNEEVNEDE
jgi:hypothetical protein